MLEKPAVDFLDPGPEPAAKSSNREPFVLMHMPKQRTRVVIAEPTTAVDDVFTSVDAPSTGTADASSEATTERPESLVAPVIGFMERLSLLNRLHQSWQRLPQAPTRGALGKALALKTEGNQHFSSGDYSRALPLYSEAIKMLEGAGEDAALATVLCNRSVAYLKIGWSTSALKDAEVARALGGGKAHFRRAEALSTMGHYAEAREAFEAALANASVSDCAASTLCC